MLKYLTQKLQNSAITEEAHHKKVELDEEQDSGTESDDNIEDEDMMDSPSPILIGHVTSTTSGPPYFSSPSSSPPLASATSDPLLDEEADILYYDPHSSEEELEDINSSHTSTSHLHHLHTRAAATPSVTSTSKRKWSQVSHEDTSMEALRQASLSSLSSDEEVTGLFCSSVPPLQFRTSPPQHALRPGGQRPPTAPLTLVTPSCSSPPTSSPRKKSRPSPTSPRVSLMSGAHTPSLQRPCLDFEKMQQMKARAVTSWRHGGELSVFCW